MNTYSEFILTDGTKAVSLCLSGTKAMTEGTPCLVKIGEYVELAHYVRKVESEQLPEHREECTFVGLATKAEVAKNENNRETIKLVQQHFHKWMLGCRKDYAIARFRFSLGRERLSLLVSLYQFLDLRPLREQLEKQFNTSVVVKALPARDIAAKIGGVGNCGRPFCCTCGLMTKVDSLTMRMHGRDFRDASNTGVCGKLCCCVAFEEN